MGSTPEQNRIYYLKNREKLIQKSKQFCIDNPEKVKAMQKRYYVKNKKKILKNILEWQKSNPELVKQYKKKSRLVAGQVWRITNKEKIRDWNRAYIRQRVKNDPEFVERKRKQSLKMYYKHKEKLLAYNKMRNGSEKKIARSILYRNILSGIIVRPSECSKCHKKCTPHGHHKDYSKPLDVIWLCALCHGQEHHID